MRAYSNVAEPHRELKLDLRDPQRGEDVRALQVACRKRLRQRGIKRDFKIDGEHGPQTDAALRTCAHFLGALEQTTEGRVFPIGAQQLIRYPGRRNPAQLQRARDRLEHLRKERDAVPVEGDEGGVSGLQSDDRAKARRIAVQAFELCWRHEPDVHYTQKAARWQGIREHRRFADGRYPNYADCSALYTWCIWNAVTSVAGMGAEDQVNGSDWTGGYTGTLLLHGDAVKHLMPGDAIIYGRAWPGVHVAMYDEDGMVLSHGSEGGPYRVRWNYRTDVLAFRRYI